MKTFRTSLGLAAATVLAAVLFAQEQPARTPFEEAMARGQGGERGSQPVSDPSANAQLEVELLPEAAQARVGDVFRFDVTVEGDPLLTANNVTVQLRASVRRSGTAGASAQEIRFERVLRKAREGDTEIQCSGEGQVRTCPVGVIGAGLQASISAIIRTNPNMRPGELVLGARALIGQTAKGARESVVQLIEKATLSDVGLVLTIESGSEVAAPGLEFDQTIQVENKSKEESATDVVVTVRQRLGVVGKAGVLRIPDDQFTTTFQNVICKVGDQKLQCALGTLRPGAKFRVPMQTSIRAELPPRSRGVLETRASVLCAERDPDPGNNRAKSSTNVISRHPELAFIALGTNARGLPEFVRQHSINRGQVFRLAARYSHVLVDPTDDEVTVNLLVNDAQPTAVALRGSAIPGDRVFRSAPFILLAPQDADEVGSNIPLRAAAGSVLKATSGDLEVAVPVQ